MVLMNQLDCTGLQSHLKKANAGAEFCFSPALQHLIKNVLICALSAGLKHKPSLAHFG